MSKTRRNTEIKINGLLQSCLLTLTVILHELHGLSNVFSKNSVRLRKESDTLDDVAVNSSQVINCRQDLSISHVILVLTGDQRSKKNEGVFEGLVK